MPAVLLTILKIIGIIIAAAVGLVIVIAAIILFVPVRYRIKAKSGDEGFHAYVNVSFLLHILSGVYRYDKESYRHVRLFGIRIWPKDVGGIDDESRYSVDWNEAESDGHEDDAPEETSEDAPCPGNMPQAEDAEEYDEPATANGAHRRSEDAADDERQDEADDEDDEPGGIAGWIKRLADRIVAKYDTLKARYDRIKKDIRFWRRMFQDTGNKNAVELVRKEALRLLRAIRPRKIKGFIHFGFEDPATCGKVLMYLSMIYPNLPRKLVFEPSFEDTDIYGDIYIKGRVFLIVPAVSFVRLYFNKDIKRMLRLYKKHKNRLSA